MDPVTALLPAAGAAGLVLAADAWHARRIRRAGRLAFGPGARPRAWTRAAPFLRAGAAAALTWSLLVLALLDGVSASGRRLPAPRHLVVLLDVSPSMFIADAGAERNQARSLRARDVLLSALERLPPERVLTTMTAFYTDALPLVQRCGDREVVANFLDRMPLHYAFAHGKTDLLKALNKAGEIGAELPRGSAFLLVLTDGDTVADTGLKPLPEAFGGGLIAGVGDASRGAYIDGHLSRQDRLALAQLARRLRAGYVDANVRQIPTALLAPLKPVGSVAGDGAWGLRGWALAGLVSGTLALAAVTPLLQLLGSAWMIRREELT